MLYGIGVSLRNFLYAQKLLKGVEFDRPVIAVGNLSLGGAGKTPHVEYLVRLLQDYLYVATLSRGYKRKTKGFRIAQPQDTVETLGDEPLQYYRKFPEIVVTVGENRMFAIPALMAAHPDIQTILLDDAYQHRSVRPGLNILLTQHRLPFTRDWLLPAGRLREWRSAYQRADIIIVTKCPSDLNAAEREALRREISPLPHQRLYFSEYHYDNPYPLLGGTALHWHGGMNAITLTALANADYLANFLEGKVARVRRMDFEDHHYYTHYDMGRLKHIFEEWQAEDKIIITTEKDATRLEKHREFILQNQLPIYVLPARVSFLGEDGPAFDQHIKDFLLQFRV